MKVPSRSDRPAHPFLKWGLRRRKSLLDSTLGGFLKNCSIRTGQVPGSTDPRGSAEGKRRYLKWFQHRAPSHSGNLLLDYSTYSAQTWSQAPGNLSTVKMVPSIPYGPRQLEFSQTTPSMAQDPGLSRVLFPISSMQAPAESPYARCSMTTGLSSQEYFRAHSIYHLSIICRV